MLVISLMTPFLLQGDLGDLKGATSSIIIVIIIIFNYDSATIVKS